MVKRMKRVTALLLVTAMTLGLLNGLTYDMVTVRADEIASGTCGTNVTWSLDGNGVLTIEGTGAMEDYMSTAKVPWNSSRSQIKLVVITGDVTSIGQYAFYGCSGLTEFTIPESVTSVGNSIFYGCRGLTNI